MTFLGNPISEGAYLLMEQRAYDSFFLCSFLGESCMINVLYGISNLMCKINQRELERTITTLLFTESDV